MPNRLASEKSPYLLQHKDNPVDWYPWGPEAFAKAKAENKPILLSIGYSTCHWCHVMERESFEVPATAAVMNEHFVCVKLDREERPDVDKLYMTAVQALTGQGGWPLNVFLTPDLKPFYGGTYFAPDGRYGRPGWTALLGNLARLWKDRRADIDKDAASLAKAVAGYAAAEEEERAKPAREAFDLAVRSLRAAYDGEHGGFGESPKFPMPANIRFLLRRHARTGEKDALEMAVETLRAMTRGGIFDQLGGGYARYSTDHAWRIPHFEKMLYDNAQLLENLAEAVLLTGDAELAAARDRTAAYLRRDLRAPGGAYFSAEDADSLPADSGDGHKEEGAFYLWRKSEVDALLGDGSKAFCERYGIVDGTNALSDPHGEFVGKCVLYDKDPKALPDDAAARKKLFDVRAKRPRPSLDDKILASWNGLAIAGLARAGAVGEAAAAAAFVRREMSEDGGKTLWRRWREGHKAVPGMADDYANMAYGLLALHEAAFDPGHLAWAITLTDEALRRFAAPGGGLYQTAEGDGAELFARAIEDHDGVEPAPSSVLTDVCLRLFDLTGKPEYRKYADETFERFGPSLTRRPLGMPFLLTAYERALEKSETIVIADADLAGGEALAASARAGLKPGRTVAGFNSSRHEEFAAVFPAAAAMKPGKKALAYRCEGGACGLPQETL